jgi:small-conductance mechanosensitive channel
MAGRVLALVLGWLALGLTAHGAFAQAAPQGALDHAQAELKALEQGAAGPGVDDAALDKLDAAIPPIETEIQAAIGPLGPELKAADLRLAALGPAPKPGAPPEAAAIAQDRRTLTAQRVALDGAVKRGKLLLVEADQLAQQLASRRIDSFSQRLGQRSQSILDPALWSAVAAKLPADALRWIGLGREEAQLLRKAAEPRALGLAGLFLAIALGVAFPMRLLLKRAAMRLGVVRRASARLKGAEIAAASVLIRSAMPVAAAAVLAWGLTWAGLLSPRAAELAWWIVREVAIVAAAYALGRTVLAPRRPEHRLARISDATAHALASYPLLLGAAAALGSLVLHANRIAGVSLAAAVAARAIVAGADLVILALAASAAGRARAAEHAAAEGEDGPTERARGLWTLALAGVWTAVITGAAALLTGYIAFAVFLTQEIAWAAIVAAVVFVLTNLTDAIFAELAPDDGLLGRFARSAMGLGPRTLDQLSVLLGGLARLVLWLLAWAAILLPFGAGTDDVLSHLEAGVTSFRLGGVTVAPAAIAASIGLFVLGLFVTRMFRRWLETQYLPRTRLDRGLSATVATGVSYFGGLIALLVASAYLGLKLTQVTLIASALTVGIGFGLQSMIQNFVAGIILLAGRPIRVGDWIAVSGQEGDVQRINVRATEIKLFDGSVLIVPNQDLVTKPVRNVTWGSPLGQVQIAFTVGYDADLDGVTAALLEAMRQVRGVLKEPAPSVAVTDFKDTGAAVAGTAYVASPRSVYRAKSDILLELSRRLRAAGIRPGVELRAMALAPSTAAGHEAGLAVGKGADSEP